MLFTALKELETGFIGESGLSTGHFREQRVEGSEEDLHFLGDLCALAFLVVLSINSLLLLLDELGLYAPFSIDRNTPDSVHTFSMANSSSALILISLAFSIASCLMNAT